MARNPSRIVALILLLSCIGTAACALMGGPNLRDLKLVSVTAVGPNNPTDDATSSPRPLRDRALLAINFTAGRDLSEYARLYEYNIGNATSLCRGNEIDESRPLQVDPYIFDVAGKVDAFRKGDSGEKTAQPGRTAYTIYVAMKSIPLAGRTVFGYDLQHDPEDVCIRLEGGNMLGDKFVSNVIVVPKSAIADALAQH